MLRSYWIAAIAFGLTVFATLGQAQEQAHESEREAQQVQPQSLSTPLPVIVIEDQGATKARERQEAESRQREIEDLLAQQGMDRATRAMNEATQDMRDYALYSTIFVGVGTALLLITLGLTYQANRAAIKAVEVTDNVGRLQVRAYISHCTTGIYTVLDDDTNALLQISFIPDVQNTGQSPAYITAMYSCMHTSDGPHCPIVTFDRQEAVCDNIVGANSKAILAKQGLHIDWAEQVWRGEKRAYLLGWVEYQDVFQLGSTKTHISTFCYELEFENHPSVLTVAGVPRPFLRQNSQPDFRIWPKKQETTEQ